MHPREGGSHAKRYRARALARAVVVLTMLTGLSAFGCRTPTAVVRLEVEPRTASVFVDGTRIAGPTDALSLRSDRSHILFVRGEGYQPQQLVLEARERNGVYVLEPAEVRMRLLPLVPAGRGVVIESAD